MVAIIAALLALLVELGLSAGPGFADAQTETVKAPMLRARVGVDLIGNLSLNATLLGAAGREPSRTVCGSPCLGNLSLRAISGFASLRFHNSGELQGFVELGLGIGRLINLSSDDLFEKPAIRGRGGFSMLVAAGARWFVLRSIGLGASLQWSMWTNVSQPAHGFGGPYDVAARDNLIVTALAPVLSIDFAPGR